MDDVMGTVTGWSDAARKNAGMITVLGVVTLIAVILGFLLLREWPLTGLWAIGTFVGVYLLFAGFSPISIASAARKMDTTPA